MPAPDIANIAITVGMTQLFCDIVSYLLVYRGSTYQRALGAFERTKSKLSKAKKQYEESLEANTTVVEPGGSSKVKKGASVAKHEKLWKNFKRSEADYNEAAAEVAKRHTGPAFLSSIVFLILLRILGTEYQGKIVAVLPFQPASLLRRLTMRGLDFSAASSDGSNIIKFPNIDETAKVKDTSQACAFIVIYLLSTFSVKYFVNRAVGTQAPDGADKGLLTVLESPRSKHFMRSMGVNPDEILKAD